MALDSKHFKRYKDMLSDELKVTALSDEEALLFAAALAQVEKKAAPKTATASRSYLITCMDEKDTELENHELLPEYIESNAHLRPKSKRSHIPEDWKSMWEIIQENIGEWLSCTPLLNQHPG